MLSHELGCGDTGIRTSDPFDVNEALPPELITPYGSTKFAPRNQIRHESISPVGGSIK